MIFRLLSLVVLLAAICNGEEKEFDTIVVGMGAAGTVAASTLARAGKKVLALEAQDRIGGRVHTVPLGDGVVEVGAEWIHGTEDSRVYSIAIKNNISLIFQDDDVSIVQSNGKKARNDIHDIIIKSFEFAELTSGKTDKPESYGDFLNKMLMDYMKEKTPDVFRNKDLVTQILELINLMIQNYEAADDWKDINAVDESETLGGNLHTSWHRHGYKTFFELTLNKYKNGPGLPLLTIKLNTEVTKIEWPKETEGKVTVTTKDGTAYKADNVIVTISLGVLKEKYKTMFSPALPQEKVTAIEKLQMGKIGKIIFSFPNAWWSGTKWYGFLWRTEDVKKLSPEDEWMKKIVGTSNPMGSSNTITMWTCGDGTRQVEILPEETVKVKALGLLRQFLGKNVTIPEPTGMIRSKWFSNEFTRGAYTYESMIAAPYPTARDDLAAPLIDSKDTPRVLFAGEATHKTRFGTVHGAGDTGHREAMRLLGAKQQ